MTKHPLLTIAIALLLWSGVSTTPAAQTTSPGPQDVLNLTVLGEEDLSRKYTSEQDGSFTFPLGGRVTARGLTLRDLEQDLRKKLVTGGY